MKPELRAADESYDDLFFETDDTDSDTAYAFNDGLDTIKLSKNKGLEVPILTLPGPKLPVNKPEKFQDVFDEMSKNVPDSTSTIKEKTTAIAYINRMLASSDISDDLKIYWQNKKEVIEQEIVRIENEQKTGSGEKVSDVWNEVCEFSDKYKKEIDSSLDLSDRKEYYSTYHSTCITFLHRLLACKDITPELKSVYEGYIKNHLDDMKGL